MPVVFITAEYVNSRNERRHRIEARHHKTLRRSEKDQRINASGISTTHTRRLLARLAKSCGPNA
jgi:hypothetical protein